MRLLVNY